jgi:hypothetical protein
MHVEYGKVRQRHPTDDVYDERADLLGRVSLVEGRANLLSGPPNRSRGYRGIPSLYVSVFAKCPSNLGISRGTNCPHALVDGIVSQFHQLLRL